MDARGLVAEEKVPASRKLGRDDAVAILAVSTVLQVAKGKSRARFEGQALRSEDAVRAMLGPTGNLRAPTLRVGGTVLVGFDPEMFEELFGPGVD